jgi:hypothetical protein
MTTDNYIAYIQDLLITIHQNIRELKERKNFADPEELAHIDGKLMAYNEVLSALRMGTDEFNIPKQEIGL